MRELYVNGSQLESASVLVLSDPHKVSSSLLTNFQNDWLLSETEQCKESTLGNDTMSFFWSESWKQPQPSHQACVRLEVHKLFLRSVANEDGTLGYTSR